MADSTVTIPKGYCQCGCGLKTNTHQRSNIKKGYRRGDPCEFISGHHSRLRSRESHPGWKGGKRLSKEGYPEIYMPSHLRARPDYVYEHILIAEKALGKPLPAKAVVHHHTKSELVICEDQAYHLFLHRRKRAIEGCGNPNWRKCQFCQQWDDPKNMTIRGYHKICRNSYLTAKRHSSNQKKVRT